LNLKTSFRNTAMLLGGSLLLVSAQAAITANALNANALTTNGLNSNALNSNALNANALTANAITANAVASNPQTTPLGAYTASMHWDLTTVRLQNAAAAR
jgi:hypothetical protein